MRQKIYTGYEDGLIVSFD
jgi:WD40 repeat protein